MQTVSLSLYRFARPFGRAFAVGMMGAGRVMLPRTEGIGAWKLCGSGVGEGFTPLPNTAVWAILATWPDEATARTQTARAPAFAAMRRRADEAWTVFLTASAARGTWAGTAPFEITGAQGDGPVAALTRATVKPAVALRFWRRVPDISAMIGADPNVIFKIGLGEVPLLHQVTFSIWPDTDTMAAFARKGGPHAEAIRAVREGGWFREELYARFRILGEAGSWGGHSPLARDTTERHAA